MYWFSGLAMVEMFDNTYKSVYRVKIGDFIRINNSNSFSEVKKIYKKFIDEDIAVIVEGHYIQKNAVIDNNYYTTEIVEKICGYNFKLLNSNTVLVNGVVCKTN